MDSASDPIIIGPSALATLAAEVAVLLVAFTLLVLRGVVRFVYLRQWPLLSDYMVVMAFICCIGHGICHYLFYRHGVLVADRPLVDAPYPIDPAELVTLFKIFYATSFPFYSGLYFSKFSILAFIHTIYLPASRTLRFAFYAVSGFVVACWLATMALSAIYCFPVEQNWDLDIDVCRTIASATLFDIACSLNIASDVLVLLLPFFMFRTIIKLPKREKFGLIVIFSLGIGTICITVARFVATQYTAATVTQVAMWSSMDAAVGLIVACLPSLKPLLWSRPKLDRLASDASSAAIYKEPELKSWTYESTPQNENPARPTAIGNPKPVRSPLIL